MKNDFTTLEELWEAVYSINEQNFPRNELVPIVGNGCNYKPKFMFIFINPTARNQSADKHWRGSRYPFLGTKQTWRIFARAGFFDKQLLKEIDDADAWSLDLAERVLAYIKQKKIYLTNTVKWTGSDAALPDTRKISLFMPILEKEIALVQPKYVVTFGTIPFERLTKQKIKLSEYYEETMKNKKLKTFDITINGIHTKVIPCYFPVGRGNPKRAVEILKLVHEL